MHWKRPTSLLTHFRNAGIAVLLLTAVLLVNRTAPVPPVEAVGGFVSDVVVGGLQNPTDFAFAPDGRIFVAERTGAVRIVKGGALLTTPFLTLVVNSRGERGLVGMALDPNFAGNGYVYVYYTVELNSTDPDGPKVGRLIRVTANGDLALPGSPVVLLGSVLPDAAHDWTCEQYPTGTDCLPADNPYHVGGGLRFGADGKLFLSIGDSGQYSFPTPLRAQNIDKLSGKVLRVNPDGTGPSDNPFYTGNPSANRSKVWQFGLRNPFRWGFWPGAGMPMLMIGDVGTDRWEELDSASGGANFGWPCYEGPDQTLLPLYNNDPVCVALYGSGTAEPPFYAYPRDPAGGAVIGGVFYTGAGGYPTEYLWRFFFADYITDTISAMHPITKAVIPVLTSARGVVDFEVGPDGNLWYLSGAEGFEQVRRLRWDAGNLPPVAVAGAAPTAGLAPLLVQFSSAGSWEPEGQALTYAWQFGDGGTSSLANPQHTYTGNGGFLATLTLTDPMGAPGQATVPISVGNAPPTASIYSPVNGQIYASGETLTLVGAGTDLEDGVLGPTSLSWKVSLVHCTPANSCHEHDYLTAVGSTFSFAAPTHALAGGDYFFARAELTVTDTSGLIGTISRLFGPDVDGNLCMDAFAPLQAFAPPFTIFLADHVLTGTAVGQSYETLGTADPFLRTTVNWAKTLAGPATQGDALSFSLLAMPLAIPQASAYAFTFDTDVLAELSSQAEGSAAAIAGVFGGVVDGGGALVGGVEVLQSVRVVDDVSGALPPVALSRVGRPFGFSRFVSTGNYYLILMVAVHTTVETSAAGGGSSQAQGWVWSSTRSSVLCQLRAGVANALSGLAAPDLGVVPDLGQWGSPDMAALASQVTRYATKLKLNANSGAE